MFDRNTHCYGYKILRKQFISSKIQHREQSGTLPKLHPLFSYILHQAKPNQRHAEDGDGTPASCHSQLHVHTSNNEHSANPDAAP